MFRKIIITIGALATSLLGSLQVQQMKLPHFEALCGAWGCLPETNTLLSIHLVWMSISLPILFFIWWAFPVCRRVDVWLICFGITAAVIAGWIGLDMVQVANSDEGFQYSWKRVGFNVIGLTQFPIVAVTMGCGMNLLLSKIKPIASRHR